MLTVLTSATSYDLTVLATVKSELGITGSTNDARLEELIHRASDLCANYCDRVFAQETVRETFRGCWGARYLLLARYPVASISTIEEDDVQVDTDEYEVDADSGALYRLSPDIRIGWQGDKVEVTYTGGYALLDSLPRTIESACIELVKILYFTSTRDPLLRSVDVPGVMSKTYWIGQVGEDGSMPPNVTSRLDRFRNMAKG